MSQSNEVTPSGFSEMYQGTTCEGMTLPATPDASLHRSQPSGGKASTAETLLGNGIVDLVIIHLLCHAFAGRTRDGPTDGHQSYFVRTALETVEG